MTQFPRFWVRLSTTSQSSLLTLSSLCQVRVPIVTMSVIQDKDFMQIFWDLAVDDADVRLQAVKKFENKDLDESYKSYSLKRLVKGLSSPRDSARLGFATALTVFLETHKPSVEEVLSLIDEHTRVRNNRFLSTFRAYFTFFGWLVP